MAVPRQLPNTITIVRILCAPVFLWLLLVDGGADGPLRWWAAALFIVAIATDGIDGWIARRYEIVTDLGKLLDPIADKVLTGFAFIGLSILGELPWWITIVVLIREVGITVHRLVVASDQSSRRRGWASSRRWPRRSRSRWLSSRSGRSSATGSSGSTA